MTGMYDIHCHILPQVDDGSTSMDVSLKMLSSLKSQGVTTVILTPHFRRRMFEPSMKLICSQFEKLKSAAADLSMSLHLGCEYHVNMDIVEEIRSGARPTLAGSRYVLCEFKGESPFSFIQERTNALRSAGYVPVIAHAERYKALRDSIDNIDELHSRGCRIQINADTIAGKEGFFNGRFARKLAGYDLIDFAIGTYRDVEQTKLLTVEEYAKGTNEHLADVKNRIEMFFCFIMKTVRTISSCSLYTKKQQNG